MNASPAKFSNIKAYKKGDVIVRENDAANHDMFILLQGNMGVYKNYQLNSEAMLTVLSQGSFHGEMPLFLGKTHENTLVALSDVIALVVNKKNAVEFFTKMPDMALNIFEGVCKKLAAADEQLAKLNPAGAQQTASARSALFPEGHGSYTLELVNTNEELLYEQQITCPVCGHSFSNLTVLQSRLKLEKTDIDLRTFYKDIEPLHYDVITCPSCFLSALADQFPQVARRWMDDLGKKVGPYKLELDIKTGRSRDTFTVFAGYYLAVLCAFMFDNHQLISANLWLRLSRLYGDCGDEKMQRYAWEKSLTDYLHAYEHFRIPERQSQQLCYLIGDLYLKLGDTDSSRTFFYNAKTNNEGSNIMKRQADQRLDEIREIRQKQGLS